MQNSLAVDIRGSYNGGGGDLINQFSIKESQNQISTDMFKHIR